MTMDIIFTKLSDEEHSVAVCREDHSQESAILNSRSFLRHDLAHLAVESELPIERGFWGQVAAGALLSGEGMGGAELALAESLAGPVQTLMRLDAEVEKYLYVLEHVMPERASLDLAARIQARGRQLEGHWKATAYRAEMCLNWPLA